MENIKTELITNVESIMPSNERFKETKNCCGRKMKISNSVITEENTLSKLISISRENLMFAMMDEISIKSINLLLKYNKRKLKCKSTIDLISNIKKYSKKLQMPEPILLIDSDVFMELLIIEDIIKDLPSAQISNGLMFGNIRIIKTDYLSKRKDKTIHNCILYDKNSVLIDYGTSEIEVTDVKSSDEVDVDLHYNNKPFINPDKVVLIKLKLGE